MSKLTFKEFLMEVDVGDLQIARQAQQQRMAAAQRVQGREEFKKSVSNTPNVGDIIKSRNGYYIVNKNSLKGIHVKQLKGDRQGVIPYGTKFELVGKSKAGKPIFVVKQNA